MVEEPASVAYDAVGTKNTLRHAIAAGDEERVRHLVEVRQFVLDSALVCVGGGSPQPPVLFVCFGCFASLFLLFVSLGRLGLSRLRLSVSVLFVLVSVDGCWSFGARFWLFRSVLVVSAEAGGY